METPSPIHTQTPAASARPSAATAQPDVRKGQRAKSGSAKSKKKTAWLFKGSVMELLSINCASIQKSDDLVTSGSHHDVLCSYNWLRRKHPTVHVPGEPPRYVAPDLPLTVRKDSEQRPQGENGETAALPRYPFEPVFRSMEASSSIVNFKDIDVLVNRNTLRKLLDFCSGRCRDSFRIDLYLVHNTLIIERCEQNAQMIIRGSGGSGYGHSFEHAITARPPGVEATTAHHRVLRYTLGSLQCAVRFEVDASYSADGSKTAMKEEDDQAPKTDLTQDMSNLTIGQSESPGKSRSKSSVTVIPYGKPIDHAAMAEIKANAKLKSLTECMPQLWFGRTSWLIRGSHKDGVFSRLDVLNAGAEFGAWESVEKNQSALRKMASVLAQLRDIVKEAPNKAGIAVCQREIKPLTLRVFSRHHARAALPQDVIGRFWKGVEDGSPA